MSVFVPALNTVQIQMQFSSGGDTNENTFWVNRSAAWTLALMQTMCDAFITWYSAGGGGFSYHGLMSSDCSLTTVSARDFTTQHGFVLVDQSGLPVVGGHAVSQIQLGCTKSFTARTGLAGKNFRGRNFSIGIPTDQADAPDLGTVKASYCTQIVTAFNALLTAVTAADALAKVVVASRFYQPGGPNTPTVPRATAVLTPITAYGFHDLNVDFQRRRAPGHARHR